MAVGAAKVTAWDVLHQGSMLEYSALKFFTPSFHNFGACVLTWGVILPAPKEPNLGLDHHVSLLARNKDQKGGRIRFVEMVFDPFVNVYLTFY